ncbi:Krueppel-like factor 7 [Acipenser ruthenus]|uniref:Krueppel-like factor 7 n=1 Tax=Acipenser ruthenus TaxID=7906 RepID=A0A444UG54_ACIRT|nr:Krueppel-like factor 7 [Acipenser ruthenus]
MDVLANHSIFQELQLVHDTGYFSALPSLEENWQQVNGLRFCVYYCNNYCKMLAVWSPAARHMYTLTVNTASLDRFG